MNPTYIQLLPTVFVRADAFPGLPAFQAAQTGMESVWDDEPTVPDRVIPNAFESTASLPFHVARELADRYEVAPREMTRLVGWMEQRSLKVNHFSKAVDYLTQMRQSHRAQLQEQLQQQFDDAPTVRIDTRKRDTRRNGNALRAPL